MKAGRMPTYVQQCKKYAMAIKTEIDGDAVEFYRKRNFKIIAIQKYGVCSWTCILATPKPLN